MPSSTTPIGASAADDAPRIVNVRVIYQGWGRFLSARIRLGSGEHIDREIEDHGAAVAVLPYDPDRGVALLVRQLRPSALMASGVSSVLEVPAGRLDTSDPRACAVREAYEEVGVRLRDLKAVSVNWAMPAISTEVIHLFLAAFNEADLIGAGGGLADEGEQIIVETVKLADLARMADAGELPDMKTHLLVLTLRHRRPDLF